MFKNCKWVVAIEKLELGSFVERGKKCNLTLQVARILLNIRDLKD
jgi:hypothetical protein